MFCLAYSIIATIPPVVEEVSVGSYPHCVMSFYMMRHIAGTRPKKICFFSVRNSFTRHTACF